MLSSHQTPGPLLISQSPLARTLLRLLLAVCLCVLAAALPESWLSRASANSSVVFQAPPADEISFIAEASFSPAGGIVQEAAWLNDEQALALVLGPAGAEIWRIDALSGSAELFLSRDFINEQICPAYASTGLRFSISPGGRYACFLWRGASGDLQQALLDLSSAPDFKVSVPQLPAGMQPHQEVFSPDDKFVVLAHDGHYEGSEVSLLVYDLAAGQEYWRIGSGELNFVQQLWWSGEPQSARFFAASEMHGGEFLASPGIASLLLSDKTWTFAPQGANLLRSSEAYWGSVSAYSGGASAAPFHLRFITRGGRADQAPVQILLNSEPLGLAPLSIPGYVLLTSLNDESSNQLWQLNLLSAKRYLVDSDCESCALNGTDGLLVRAGKSNRLRFYRLKLPVATAPAAASAAVPTPDN